MLKFPKLPEEDYFSSKYLLDLLPNAVFCLGSDARFLYLNDATCSELGYSRSELLSMKLSDIDPDFSQKTWRKQWQSLQQKKSLTVESRHRTRSDELLPVELTFTYVKDMDKEFSCVFVRKVEAENSTQDTSLPRDSSINNLYQEISQLKQAESQLAKTLSLVRGTLDSTAYGTIAISYQGEVISHNQKFLELWKIPNSLVLSKDNEECQNFFASQLKHPEVFDRSVWKVSRKSDAETYDILELNDGRIFAQYSKPQRLDNEIIGRVWSIWDITELKYQTELELHRSEEKLNSDYKLEEARQFSELRSRFLSMLCHQFRSSLNIISFSNSLLKRYGNGSKQIDDKKISYLNNIQTAVKQINLLLDELVFYGRSEVGQITFDPKPTDLAVFCRNLIEQMQPLSDSKEQTIKFVSHLNRKTVGIDGNILHHIITNLLSNAIKYSPNGSEIKFEILDQKEQVVIKISDRGIGISEVDQRELFDAFFRGNNVGDIAGNGLGLSIVENLVEIHGGKIEVESKVGIGTTFLLALTAKSLDSEKSIA